MFNNNNQNTEIQLKCLSELRNTTINLSSVYDVLQFITSGQLFMEKEQKILIERGLKDSNERNNIILIKKNKPFSRQSY